MKETPKMRKLYLDIQDKLFYMIPESFTKIYLYTSIIDQVRGMPIGEMYFYYFPKGIFKKNPVNVYEIPNKFNIDEDVYSKLINDLYSTIKKLRDETIASGQKVWTNFTLSIEDYKFSIEYHYDDITLSPYSNYERHVIWRYKYLQTDLHTYNRRDQNLIKRYLQEGNEEEEEGEVYQEAIYANKKKNIIGYETTSENKEEPIKKEISKEKKEKEKNKEARQKEIKQQKEQKEIPEKEIKKTEINQILNIQS